MAMRTPLGRVRGLGSAKDGTEHFWRQRLTALAMVPLTVFFVFLVAGLQGEPLEVVRATVANPFVAVLLMAFVATGALHMKIGMQVIIEDYVHADVTKFLLLALNIFFAAIVALSGLWAIVQIGFGG